MLMVRVVLIIAAVVVLLAADVTEASHLQYEERKAASASLVSDHLRPGYHFHPPKNWMNDPNGPMYYKGIYHLFYQWNPAGSVWGNIRWAHSYSSDLINWKPLPLAITPTKPFDINGCWSGSATILPGLRPAILYTGIDSLHRQVQNIAFPQNLSDPLLLDWYKPDYNPVITPVDGINASEFRDPSTAWYANGHWNVIVGSRRHCRGLVYLYKSKDFVQWRKNKHPLHTTPRISMLECVDFYPVSAEGELGLDTSSVGPEVKHVLKASLDNFKYDYYTVGKYEASLDTYSPDSPSSDNKDGLRYDYGNFYASKTFFDPVKHRRILWGWSNESDGKAADNAKGWAGLQAIPRRVWLDENGQQLVQWPIEEVETLRGNSVFVKQKLIGNGEHIEIKGIETAQADVEVNFDVSDIEKAEPFDPAYASNAQALCDKKGAEVKGGVGPFGLVVLASSDVEEGTFVFFRLFKAYDKHVVLMCTDITKSTLNKDPNIYKPNFAGFVDVDIAKTGKISLRSLIDNSVVESFGAGGKTCITSRIYPIRAVGKDAKLFVFNNGLARITVSELKAWEMKKPLMNDS